MLEFLFKLLTRQQLRENSQRQATEVLFSYPNGLYETEHLGVYFLLT